MQKLLSIFLVLLPFIGIGQMKYDPKKEALRLFNEYKPKIEETNDAIVDDPKIFVGDLNEDGLPDCVIAFAMTPKNGGNGIVGSDNVIYLNTGKGMKVTGAFPHFRRCYFIDSIEKGVIYIEYYKCAPPYNEITGQGKLVYQKGKIVKLKSSN